MVQFIPVLLYACRCKTGCSDVMDYCRKASPLEGSKNIYSLLKKPVCVCVWVGGYVCVGVDRCMEKGSGSVWGVHDVSVNT